ncbi:MAG TPA: DUF5710 domain-containing protein [Rhodocyclaceae bacterium]|nr:DUF5710 domain-containing protein [Rhodocyclaceae bacterium]
MRTNLKVPFAEKDQAKKLGARWDAARKIWYVDGDVDLAPFSKWSPTPHEGAVSSGVSPLPQKKPVAKTDQSAGHRIVGSNYVAVPRVCECLPWDDCEKCRSAA